MRDTGRKSLRVQVLGNCSLWSLQHSSCFYLEGGSLDVVPLRRVDSILSLCCTCFCVGVHGSGPPIHLFLIAILHSTGSSLLDVQLSLFNVTKSNVSKALLMYYTNFIYNSFTSPWQKRGLCSRYGETKGHFSFFTN